MSTIYHDVLCLEQMLEIYVGISTYSSYSSPNNILYGLLLAVL